MGLPVFCSHSLYRLLCCVLYQQNFPVLKIFRICRRASHPLRNRVQYLLQYCTATTACMLELWYFKMNCIIVSVQLIMRHFSRGCGLEPLVKRASYLERKGYCTSLGEGRTVCFTENKLTNTNIHSLASNSKTISGKVMKLHPTCGTVYG